MRAHVLTKYGKSNDVIAMQDMPDRAPGPDQVRVRITAFAVNPADIKTRNGGAGGAVLPFKPPFVPGLDLAGVVEAVGRDVTHLTVGQPVWSYTGMDRMGAFAEAITLDAWRVAPAPRNIDAGEAAAVPLPALCALQALQRADVQPGNQLLVHGGAGAVGSMAVQLGRHLGARVIATASARDADKVRALGADEVIDYRSQRFEEVISEVDVVFDTIGGETLSRSWNVVKRDGCVATLHVITESSALTDAGLRAPWFFRLLLPVVARGHKKSAERRGARLVGVVATPNADQLAEIASLMESGALRTSIDRRFSFDDFPAALEHVASGKARGRVVVEVPS